VVEPQVLVGGDVAEIPRQRAHDRRQHRFELFLVQMGDEAQRPLAHLGHHGVQLSLHYFEHTEVVSWACETLRPVAATR
jgi:hypothetical protein